jgi:16S rRNA (guanine966-N2)-methyltransferase
MRIISGEARGRKLKRVPGDTTRPITDRVKENLFNIIGRMVVDSRWLDLFAGTGQVGLEALSRGAASAVFTDNNKFAYLTTQGNIRQTGLTNGAELLRTDAFNYLRSFGGQPFDFIYIAPPQYKGLWRTALTLIDAEPDRLLTAAGTAVVQIHPKEFEPLPLTHLVLSDQRRYGATMLCFYRRPTPRFDQSSEIGQI